MNTRGAFTNEEARGAWNQGAAAWDEFVESAADWYRHAVHGPALLAACEPVADRDILDLGCGQGYFSRALARRGAHVIGIDITEELVAYAREHETRAALGIEYRLLNAAEAGRHLVPESFDLITACMALQDMADVSATLRVAYALLRPRGRLVFSVPHPCTDTPYHEWDVDEHGNRRALKVDRYFESGPATCCWGMARLRYHWETPYWRYTLTEWSAMLMQAGFLIRRLIEPRPTPAQVKENPRLEDSYRVPYFLIVDALKPRELDAPAKV